MAEIYVSTDVETDGPIPGPHSMLSFASAAYQPDKTLVGTFSANLETLPGAAGASGNDGVVADAAGGVGGGAERSARPGRGHAGLRPLAQGAAGYAGLRRPTRPGSISCSSTGI